MLTADPIVRPECHVSPLKVEALGLSVLPPDTDQRQDWQLRCATLNPAEIDVAQQLKFGLSNKEIAQSLGKSEVTVKHQIGSILQKLGVGSRTRAVVLMWWHERSDSAASPTESALFSRGDRSSRLDRSLSRP